MVAINQRSFDRIMTLTSYWDAQQSFYGNRGPDYITMARVFKLAEEVGEVTEALIGALGDNPRKGFSHSYDDVVAELADVILTAMCAMAHIIPDDAVIAQTINERIRFVFDRAFSSEERESNAPTS